MSADLQLNQGDLALGSNGDLGMVRNTTKLVQDVLKVIHTPIGSNPFFPTIGISLTASSIGEGLGIQFAETKIRAEVTKAINLLQQVQQRQQQVQVLSPEETIGDIVSLKVGVNPLEPRQYDIKLAISSEGLTNQAIVLPSFALSTTE